MSSYQGMIDQEILNSGQEYRELKDVYIIFICTFDPFGKGLYRYSFQHICKELPAFELDDKIHWILYNTKGDTSNAPKEIKDFLTYIENGKVNSPLTEMIDREVVQARINEDWRLEYMKSFTHDMDVRREGYDEGYDIGLTAGRSEGLAIGHNEGLVQGITSVIHICRKASQPDEQIIATLVEEFGISQIEAEKYLISATN